MRTILRRRPSRTPSSQWKRVASYCGGCGSAFFAVSAANTNPELQKVRSIEAPKLAAHRDAIYLDAKLFQRVATIYNSAHTLKLDPESLRLVEYYLRPVRACRGQTQRCRQDRTQEAQRGISDPFQRFQHQAAGRHQRRRICDYGQNGAGRPERRARSVLRPRRRRAARWRVSSCPLQNTTQQPDLVALSNRATREALFANSWGRAERGDANDTRDTIARIAQLRAQKGKLLGFPNFAAWNTGRPDGQNAGSGAEVHGRTGARGNRQGRQRSPRHPGCD